MASKIFILDNDYQRIIKTEIKDEIADPSILRKAEEEAITEMIGYLNARYDITNLFPAIKLWNSRALYSPGDYVDYFGNFVRAILPTNPDANNNQNIIPAGAALSLDGTTGEDVFWTDFTFPNIKDWDDEPVLRGQYRVSADVFYRAMVDSTNQLPSDNLYNPNDETGVWLPDDPRDPELVGICCRLALYKAHARIAPDAIPELRQEEHDMAIEQLKEIAQGNKNPQLPILPKTEENRDTVQFGSQEYRGYTF